MFQSRFLLNAMAAAVMTLTFTSIAQAQLAQTFVSAQRGDDGNDCSLARPCRSFSRALEQVQAKGEVTAIDSGDYAPFTIKGPVTVQAAPGVYAGIAATSSNAVEIILSAPDVVALRGLTFNGLNGSYGIRALMETILHVENCVINGFIIAGIEFQNGGQLFVKDTVVRNSSLGIHLFVSSPTAALIDHCRLEKNSVNGLHIGSNNVKVTTTVRDTVAAGNSGAGFNLIGNSSGTLSELNLENCVATNNGQGIHCERVGATVRVSNSTITNNTTGLSTSVSGSIISHGNNTVEGNTTNGNFTGTFTAK